MRIETEPPKADFEFRKGLKIVTIKNTPTTPFEQRYSFGPYSKGNYPKINSKGVLVNRIGDLQWEIKWGKKQHGDLIFEWMMKPEGKMIKEKDSVLVYREGHHDWSPLMSKHIGKTLTIKQVARKKAAPNGKAYRVEENSFVWYEDAIKLLRNSPQKLKVGNTVIITHRKIYPGYEAMAEKMKATKWKRCADAPVGTIGVIKCIKPHLLRPKDTGNIALVDLGDKEILCGVSGLKLYDPNELYGGDMVLIVKKILTFNKRKVWDTSMDKTIGRIGLVRYVDDHYGVAVRIRGMKTDYEFSPKSLEKIPKEEVY